LKSTVLELGSGSLLTPSPWRQAWGRVDLDGKADLFKLASRWQEDTLPFSDIRGTVEVHASVARDSLVDMTPEVDVTLKTQGLVLAGPRLARGWRIEGVDPTVHVEVNGDTGATSMKAELDDSTGTLVQVELRVRSRQDARGPVKKLRKLGELYRSLVIKGACRMALSQELCDWRDRLRTRRRYGPARLF